MAYQNPRGGMQQFGPNGEAVSLSRPQANSNVLAAVTTAQNIGAAGTTPVYLMGVQIRTALTGTLTINGFTDPTGAAAPWVLPVGSVGAVLPPGNARRMETGCTMVLSVATDGPFVVVDWEATG